jgi:glycosyltransferase A (GT-A) superfamily protein (DUF2064 family)
VSGAVAIFVKTPGRSPVKTRLAATVGVDRAEAWYVRAAAAIADVVSAAAASIEANVYWAVAEPEAIANPIWSRFAQLLQGEGTLGVRMGRVHAELVRRHGHAALVGADAPQLAVDDVVAALRWCAHVGPRQAIGPARDGGFWLYAGNRVAPIVRWESVAYSRSDTATAFRAAFHAEGEWLELPTLTDVDGAADLGAMRRELAARAGVLPAQRTLADWMSATFDTSLDGVVS